MTDITEHRPERPISVEELTYGRLIRRRVLFLTGTIEGSVAHDLAAQMLALDAESDQPITLYIDSPGGQMTGMFTIHDTMQMLRSPVETRCLGMAASSAAVILATGTGRRYATPNARILIHQPHGGAQGSARDIEIQAREVAFLRRRMEEILAERTGQSVERIHADTDRDYWLSATEAVAYGLIDEVDEPVRPQHGRTPQPVR